MKIKGWAAAIALISQLGISMCVPIFLCVMVGIFLDNKTGLSPLFLMIFIILGVGSAFRNLFYMTSKITPKKTKEVENNEKNHSDNDNI